MAMFQSLLERTGPEHYAVVVSLIRENDLKGSGSAGEWSKLWASWGTRDPIGAMEYIRTQNWSGWSDQAPLEAKNRTLTFWAQTDPESARRFVEESSEIASGDRSFVSGLVRGWSNVDPAGAAQWLFKSGLGMRDEYGAVVEAISRKGGPEALDAWFSGINQAGAPAKDISGFAQIIVQNKQAYQPEKAAAWVEQHLGEPWVAESEIVRSTAHFFASQDPANAMAWAQRTGLESASTMAMSTWCQRDLPAASQWLKENESSPSYSTAASVLGMYLQRNDPAAAKAFAESISNGSVRERVLRQIQGN